jgi:hypothetical protein
MGWLRDFRLNVAYYFGLGEGSDRVRESDHADESWLPVAVGAVLVPALAFVLGGVLGFGEDFVGRLSTVGLVAVLATVWGLIMRVERRGRKEAEALRGDGSAPQRRA